jgi:lipid-A-disaccharide synthase-like uncharacterized protein
MSLLPSSLTSANKSGIRKKKRGQFIDCVGQRKVAGLSSHFLYSNPVFFKWLYPGLTERSHIPSLAFFASFFRSGLMFFPGLTSDHDPSTYISPLAGITVFHHHAWPVFVIGSRWLFCPADFELWASYFRFSNTWYYRCESPC